MIVDEESLQIKIILVGEARVGKTSLRRNYLGYNFETNYLPTIGADFSTKRIEAGSLNITALIWDLAGQEFFDSLMQNYYQAARGVLLVYDVTNKETTTKLATRMQEIIDVNKKYSPLFFMIIGNKIDLEHRMVVSNTMHETLVKELQTEFQEHHIFGCRTSALTGKQVSQAFTNLLFEIAKHILAEVKNQEIDNEAMLHWKFSQKFEERAMVHHLDCGKKYVVESLPVNCEYCNQELDEANNRTTRIFAVK